MIHQVLLRKAASDSHPVLQDFVETIAPYVLVAFADVPALGGSGKPAGLINPNLPPNLGYYDDKAMSNFSKLHDQSLATHLFNGLFAGAKITERLPEDKQLSEIELRVWVLSFLVHDYTKVYGIKIEAGRLVDIRQIILTLGETLHFSEFLANWTDYLDDIMFIAQNTQKVDGANLNLRDYPQRKIQPRRLETLRLLASYADLLVHITSPTDVAMRDIRGRDIASNLQNTLQLLFGAGRAPRLTYHRLAEVRGLLSNLINNALIAVLKEQGYEPYLFFPNGVVYLTSSEKTILSYPLKLVKDVWLQAKNILLVGDAEISENELDMENEEDEEESDGSGGFGVRPLRGLKVAPALYELLSINQLLVLGKEAALKIKGSAALDRVASQLTPDRIGVIRGLSPEEKEKLSQQYGEEFAVLLDNRTDKIAEFLHFIWRRVLDALFPDLEKQLATKQPAKSKPSKGYYLAQEMLQWLSLENKMTPDEASFQMGGRIPTGWYYTAGLYLKQHPQIDPQAIDVLFDELINKTQEFVAQQGMNLGQNNQLENAFFDYVSNITEIDGTRPFLSTNKTNAQFATELANYSERKSKNKLNCSMCSSPFEAIAQPASVVLFKGQQYSNKGKLAVSSVKRGICPICSLELMLRQVQQGMPAKSAQDQKPVTLYLYPTYFFTAETSRMIRLFIHQLEDLNILKLIFSHLGKAGFTAESVLHYENYIVDENDIPRSFFIKKPHYSDSDLASLFLFTLNPSGKKPTDTDSWIIPTFYALALPLMLNLKVVATTSFVPLYNSGVDFRETAILDAPHTFTRYALGKERFRVGEIAEMLERVLRLYELHLDVYRKDDDDDADKKINLHWGLLNSVAKDIATDPYYVFQYYDKKSRNPSKKGAKNQSNTKAQGITKTDLLRYTAIYQTLGGKENMGFIGELVDNYARFYRAQYDKLDSAYAIGKPLAIAIDAVVESNPKTEFDDLLLLVAGAVQDNQVRIWSDNADGFDPIVFVKDSDEYRSERQKQSRQCVEEFAALFLTKCFKEYCNQDRSILREKANRIRSAARFYYLQHYATKKS